MILLKVSIAKTRHSRGIYLREPYEVDKLKRFSIVVEAVFHEDARMLQSCVAVCCDISLCNSGAQLHM